MPPPRSVASPTRTGRVGRFGRVEVEAGRCRGRCSTSGNARARCRSRAGSGNRLRRDGCRGRRSSAARAGRGARRRRDSSSRAGKSLRTQATSAVFSATCDCTYASGCSRFSAPGRLELRGRGRRREARRDRVARAGPCRASARSAPSTRRSRAARCRVSARGALRSISTLPAIIRSPGACASSKSTSTDSGWTVQKTAAVVMPCRRYSRR